MAGPSTSIPEFAELLTSIHANNGRVLALCGAGLSAASGLGTFRGAGGLWRRYSAVELATVDAFLGDAGLVVCGLGSLGVSRGDMGGVKGVR